jgi:hypothetical protein
MDPCLIEPFRLLIRYAAIVIALASGVPALLAQFYPTFRARNLALVVWFATPAMLGLVTFECGRLCFIHPILPRPFFLLLFATWLLSACLYVRLAPILLGYLQSRVEQEQLTKLREEQRDVVFRQVARFLAGGGAEPAMTRRCMALLRRLLRCVSGAD